MEQYLSETLNKLKSNNYSELNIVLGNESCDLDSAVSAFVYAIFLHWQHNQIKCKVCTKDKRNENVKDNIYIPLLDVDREDFNLKTEVAYCFKENGITADNLIFRDDINLKNLSTSTNLKVILVDHHILAKKYEFLTPYVIEIIDHRPIATAEWKYKDDTRSTIQTVGSCATLVAQRIKDLSSLISKNSEFFTAYPKCSKLLHCAIILDTVNFSNEVKKGTPHDEEIVLFLESILNPDDYKENRKCMVERLTAARSDVSSLTAPQLLKKDVKIIGDVLIPSFPIPVKDFLQKPNALQAVCEALTGRDCSIALLLGMKLAPGLERDAAIYGPTCCDKVKRLANFLREWNSSFFQLSPQHGVSDSEDCHYFQQVNLVPTRKQYIPIVNEFIKSCQ